MKNKKSKKIQMISTIIIIICLYFIGISTYRIINWYQDTKEVEKIKEETNKSIIKKDTTYQIDFNNLKKQNSDTVAYLKVNNTNIDYIIVKGKDNDFYLNHDFNKNYNVAGWVFATYQNEMDETDKNIVIFGHNMRDGNMFGTLKNILKGKWYNNEKNLTIKLITEKNAYNYKIFSIYQIKPEDYYINTEFNNDNEYEQFLKTIEGRSIKNFNIELNKNDQILTLSTCSMTGTERVVLHAKKI